MQTRVYTAKSDVYSFGVLLWELFSGGATPFGDMTAGEAFRAVCAGHRLPRPRASTHENIVQLIRDTTASNVQSRPAMPAVSRSLNALLAVAMRGERLVSASGGERVLPAATTSHSVNPVFHLERHAWRLDNEEEENETTDL